MPISSAGGMGRAWQRLRGLPGRTPLRVKLITAVLALVAVALAVISFTGISVLRGYLLNQYDNTLQGLANQADHAVGQYVGGLKQGTSAATAVAWVPSGGKLHWVIVPTKPSSGFNSVPSPAAQAQVVPGPPGSGKPGWLAANLGHYVTVAAQSGGGHWRVLVEPATYVTANGTITGT